MHYLDVSPKGIENLKQRGVALSTQAESSACCRRRDPCRAGRGYRLGALLMTLDPAAPLDNRIPHRDDIGCIIAHPCHPSVFIRLVSLALRNVPVVRG